MNSAKLLVEKLKDLLERPATDPDVLEVIGQAGPIKRSSDHGFVELKNAGVSMMFKEARSFLPPEKIVDPEALYVSALHLHRKKHEGYAEYRNRLPSGLVFGDSEAEVVRKLGEPEARGGGGLSSILNRPIARWVRYRWNDCALHLQLDANNRVEMATLYPWV